MAARELKSDERVSVARATALIRKANKEKADLLNDMQQQGNISADGEIPATTYARTQKGTPGDPKSNKIELNPKKVNLLDGANPLGEDNPDLITLAGTLLHEADHAQCHDEMACFGAEVEFYSGVNREFDKYFPGVPAAQKAKIEKQKKALEKEAKDNYERIARKGGAGYGKDHKDVYVPIRAPGCDEFAAQGGIREAVMIRVLPDVPASDVAQHLEEIALKIYAYYDRAGTFPPSGNAALVKSLRKTDSNLFRRDELNESQELIDPWGRPYGYRSPGVWYPDDFDLYSLGPCGRDEGGGGDNILCELHRR